MSGFESSKYLQIQDTLVEYPISVDKDGLNLKPEKMEKERLYHCMFKDKVMLVFKDSQDVLNCYEIEDTKLVEKIRTCGNDDDLEKLFEEHIQKLQKKS